MRFIYGTAWKENATQPLVSYALAHGFRAIDTANQRKHYFEGGVGEALAEAYAAGIVKRSDLWLQTKFTYARSQDPRRGLPFDPSAPVAKQVAQSCASSLEHLGTDVIDSYLLHGLSQRVGLAPEDHEAWAAMEELHAAGKVRAIGISNVNVEQLELLLRHARVKPACAQIRCFAENGWDRDLRALCRAEGIAYQGYSLLNANRREVDHPTVTTMAAKRKITPQQLIYRFAFDVGMIPLNGTTNQTHMKEDIAVLAMPPLSASEVAAIENLA